MNDYPLEFIFDNINNRLKNIIKFKSKKSDSNNAKIIRLSWFTVSYVPTVFEKFNRLNSDDIKISFYHIVLTNYRNSLRCIKIRSCIIWNRMSCIRFIVKLRCYVGQTGRQFPDENVKFVEVSKKCSANENGLKWIQIFRNMNSWMLKWILFNLECTFIHL